MAVNDSRSMTAEFHQGSIDQTYIQLTPNRVNPENPPVERLDWPTFVNAERWPESPHLEAHLRRSMLPTEHKVGTGSDPRF